MVSIATYGLSFAIVIFNWPEEMSFLSRSNCGLFFHDGRLPKVDKKLANADSQESDGQDNLSPVRGPHIDKGFRGIPMALGWLAVLTSGWLFVAHRAHDRQSLSPLHVTADPKKGVPTR